MQATNYVQKGRVLSVVAPYSRVAGEAAMIGSLLGVAHYDVTNGAVGVFDFEGTWNLAKTSAQAWTLGDKIYWNAGTKFVTNVPTDGPLVGTAMATAANPSDTGRVRLNGVAAATAEGPQAAIANLTDNSGGTTADGTIGAIAATAGACAGSATPSATQVDTAIATAVASIVTGSNDAVKELAAKINLILADIRAAGVIAT